MCGSVQAGYQHKEDTMTEQRRHPSHVTMVSDASSFDEICINCGNTDQVPGGWGELANPCPKPVGAGGMTFEQYYNKRQPTDLLRDKIMHGSAGGLG